MKYIYILALGLILSAASWAHGDEDHGAEPHPAPTQTAVASAESASNDFEVLAQMDGEMLTIYLNRYADNQPISNAVLEVESGAFKAKLKAVASGVYQAQAAPLAKAGEHSLVIMLQSGEQSDLLDASLTVAASSAATESKSFAKWWPIVGGSAAVLLLLLVALRRRGGQTK